MDKRNILLFLVLIGLFFCAKAQKTLIHWNLDSCLNYAFVNNIQIQKSQIGLEQNQISTQQAKAQLFPNLSASIGQNLSMQPFPVSGSAVNSYTGSYGINSSVTLFNGGILQKNIRQQKLLEETGEATLLDSKKEIEMSILQAYLQILYANEAVKINKQTLEVSKYQRDRAESLLQSGSISKVDLAQLDAQYSSDKYQVTIAESTLRTNKFTLKQLLELDASEDIEIEIIEIDELNILNTLPGLESIYNNALETMPEMRISKIDIEIAQLETQKAKAGYLPKISLNASVGSGHTSASAYNFSEQMQNSFNGGVGVSVSIPILSNRENRSAVEIAKLNERASELSLIETEKNLLKEVESIYLDAIAAQEQYISANEQVVALQASYDLIEQQYNLGMKNTLELLTERNNLTIAQQSLLQAKFISLMNIQLLNLYQNFPISIN